MHSMGVCPWKRPWNSSWCKCRCLCVVGTTRYQHRTPVLPKLHWLLMIITYKDLHGPRPRNLKDRLTLLTSAQSFRLSNGLRRSSACPMSVWGWVAKNLRGGLWTPSNCMIHDSTPTMEFPFCQNPVGYLNSEFSEGSTIRVIPAGFSF